MKKILVSAMGLCFAAAPIFADGHATGDAEAGEAVFKQCKACHSIVADDDTVIFKGGQTGPNLYGMLGRQAGTYPDFRYGDSIVEAGDAGLEWNETDILAYLEDPKDFLREYLDDRRARSKMSFKVRKEEDALNVWAYLVSVGPELEADEGTASN